MEQSMPRTMAATSWWLLICLAATAVLRARAQPDRIGFISIDCGLPGTASYVDDTTKLSYAPDAAFTDAGSNQNISAAYITPNLGKLYLNVRSFPNGARNCYTIRSLEARLKYILRATFMYGNYDGLSRPPIFDLYVGVNFWSMVNITGADSRKILEVIVVVPDNFVQVCLVNTGSGTPFISALELRPLTKSSLYPQANATQGLVLLGRINFGATDDTRIVRYPDDPRDRFWFPWVDATSWNSLSTTLRVQNIDSDLFEAPLKVMQTAITPRNASKNIEFFWDSEPQPKDPTPGYIGIMHFSELQLLPGNAVRQFYINLDGKPWYPKAFTPEYLYRDATYNINPYRGLARYNISINATANSTLPPIINAVEVFSVISTTNVGTDSQDVSAITAIKVKYRVQKNWMGDPCGPKTLSWNGLTCSYGISSPPRITGVNISFSGIDSDISSSFANLKAVQYLDLSHNNLTGSIPEVLSQLPSLTLLDLTDNQLNGSIPPGLLKRIEDGSLDLRYGNNPNLCSNADSCPSPTPKKKSRLAVYIAVPVVLVVVVGLLVALLCCFLRRKKQESMSQSVKPQNEAPTSHVPPGDAYAQSSLQLENRRFTYKELEMITNNFQRVLGRGGFGEVYDGFLEDGTQVAVKLRSQSSNQGVKQFLAEAQILTRIHHKNLVSMIGYCKDGQYMALVYEYMSEGTLREQLAGNGRNRRSLTWRQRLRIALESAQGLEYLHKGCNPPLIHRDVKTTNILLNTKLEAKIADFGLSKAFNLDNEAHMSTNIFAGTLGYVDPECQATLQPTTKSDVYSFGVVLLELVTGRQAIMYEQEPTNIIQWVRQRLARGNIEEVVDARMHGEYDVNSVWKAANVALKCTVQVSAQRPTMTDVVAQLQEGLELEEGHTGGYANASFYTGGSSDPNSGYNAYAADDQSIDVSQGSTAFEMEHNFGKVPRMNIGPVAR
ncbi:putative leucine-rich repeat receptor-like serine/threonine-protein kinase At2g19230 [Phragmites australis]|uniref:putative leucine-rich repeat receptor-like serine/threonine-protein kinase At2g19230 n=1 Tax=Phragmites australis TaxID=29695 RepID=UPI002D7657F2|nr:putative leucine-rich repeat receptor-like serine/threonine-protein kinase At2g19230 [Phragmites australis]